MEKGNPSSRFQGFQACSVAVPDLEIETQQSLLFGNYEAALKKRKWYSTNWSFEKAAS
jgi:hypothetical protein